MADATPRPPPPTDKPLCFVTGPIGEAGSDVRKHADFMLREIIKPTL